MLQFATLTNLKTCGWIKAQETIIDNDADEDGEIMDTSDDPDDRKFTSCDIDFHAQWDDVMHVDTGDYVGTQLKYMSFDLECKSKNVNSKNPDAMIPANEIFSICSNIGNIGVDEKKNKIYIFTTYRSLKIKNVNIIRGVNEKELLLKFFKHIGEEDPDMFITYNGMAFDWDYIIKRSNMLGITNRMLSVNRLSYVSAEKKEVIWKSGAYGKQSFFYPDYVGRINLDMIIEIKRNYKLNTYGMGVVAEHFLGETKDPITPYHMFVITNFIDEYGSLIFKLNDGEVPKQTRIEIKKSVQKSMPIKRATGFLKDVRTKLMNASLGSTFKNVLEWAMQIILYYNWKDTILPVRLCEKLNTYYTLEAMAQTTYVPMSYLHTRGQQIKVVAQLYRTTVTDKYIIPHNDRMAALEKYQGALVVEANPGHYLGVLTEDFESLYPTTMIAYNIDYTTLVRTGDTSVKDEDCNIIQWEDHLGCEHDPKKRKKKAEDVLCGKQYYRFKKVIIHPDGTRENEGVMPKLERNLLTERKKVKRELAKVQATIAMHDGKASESDIADFRKYGYVIIEKGSLSAKEYRDLKIKAIVLDALQLALKVSANSGYGILGAQMGFCPLVAGAASVTAMGRFLITMAIKYVLANYKDARLIYGDTDSCMLNFPGYTFNQMFDVGGDISRRVTHYLKCYLLSRTYPHIDESYTIPLKNKDDDTIILYTLNKFPIDRVNDLKDDTLKIIVHTYTSIPINLQHENVYEQYLLLSQKRYIGNLVNRDGKTINNVKKGICLTRRDNCAYLKSTYTITKDDIMSNKTREQTLYDINDEVNKMFTMRIPENKFTIYMGIKDVIDYATKKKFVDEEGVEIEMFVDKDKQPIYNIEGPNDERLVYRNIPQCLLARKMMSRGDIIPSNTRLEFLYIEKEDVQHQGDKAEDYEYYVQHKKILNLRPDYLHYVEKQLAKPITEIVNVKFPPFVVPYEKMDDTLENIFKLLNAKNSLIYSRMQSIKTFTKTIHPSLINTKNLLLQDKKYEKYHNIIVDKDVTINKTISLILSRTSDDFIYKGPNQKDCNVVTEIPYKDMTHKILRGSLVCDIIDDNNDIEICIEGNESREYKSKGVMAKINYLLYSVELTLYEDEKNCMDPGKHKDIINFIKRYKSRDILNKLYNQFSLKKPKLKSPPKNGIKLPTNTKVVFEDGYCQNFRDEEVKTSDKKRVEKMTTGVVIKVIKEEKETKPILRRKRKDTDDNDFYYDVFVEGKRNGIFNDIIFYRVPRSDLKTYYLKDATFMYDIHSYRTNYRKVLNQFNDLFDFGQRSVGKDCKDLTSHIDKFFNEYKDLFFKKKKSKGKVMMSMFDDVELE
jgi:DNA polymerase elongation subunit (family B)